MSNKYITLGDTTILQITRRNGEVVDVLIDTDMLPLVSKYHWLVDVKKNGTYYIKSFTGSKWKQPVRTYLHRLLTNAPKGAVVDHIDRNTLNNRLSNLRVVDKSTNNKNRGVLNPNNKTSGFRGVTWHKRRNKWMAKVEINGKRHFVGYFKELDDAVKAVQKYRKEHGFLE